MDLIKPDQNIELVKDLSAKTGLDILKVRIESINLNEQIANVYVYYRERDKKNNVVSDETLTWKKFKTLFKRDQVFENN